LFPGTGASLRDIADWQAAAPDAAITGFRVARLGMAEGINETLFGLAVVQPNFFDTIGVRPLVGGLVPSDFNREDVALPVVITYELWQRRFHGASDAIGQTYIDDPTSGRGVRVAGVMPRGFVFPSGRTPVNFIAPYVLSPDVLREPHRRIFSDVIARLPQGISMAALTARVEAGMAATAAAFPTRPRPAGSSDRGWRMEGPFDRADVRSLVNELRSTERPLFGAIFLAALVLLVLGGLNMSGLMAARGLDRAHELGLRRALGATGPRLSRLVQVEALAPIAVAAGLGLWLAVPLLRQGVRLLPDDLVLLKPQLEPTIDVRVVMFVVLSATALAILTTIGPIRRALGTGATSPGAGTRGSRRARSTGRTVVIVLQVAGALVLTLGGALLVTSIMAVYSNTPAIQTEGIVVLRESMQGPGGWIVASPDRTTRINALIRALQRVPGVEGVAITDGQVLDGGGGVPWWIPPSAVAPSKLPVVSEAVTSEFYRVLQPRLVMGRFPTDAELDGNAPVIVVSEAVARVYWPTASPLGQTLMYARGENYRDPFTVVGVVKDVRWNRWDTDVAAIYGPFARVSRSGSPTVFIRTRNSADQIIAAATRAIAAIDPLVRTTHSGTLGELFADSVLPRRLQSWLFGSFAVAALVIVGAGILGLIAMSTARRTREMGIRLALGATRQGLVQLLLREQLLSVAGGVVVGTALSAWAVRFVRSYLYEITPYDPRVWAVAIVVIVATTVIGTLVPSLRASQADPVKALRVE
jgi:predicted permease